MKIPEEIIRTRMLKLNKQYIADLCVLDIADMMEEYAEQFKISSNLPVIGSKICECNKCRVEERNSMTKNKF